MFNLGKVSKLVLKKKLVILVSFQSCLYNSINHSFINATFIGVNFKENRPCYKGNYDAYLMEQVTREMLTRYGCTVVFDPLSDFLPVCNYTQAVKALEYYEKTPATSDVLWKMKKLL